jgi:hypothetical protein
VGSGYPRAVFCHDTSRLARPGWSTTRRRAQFVPRRLIVDRSTVATVARELGRSWDAVDSVAVEATRKLPYPRQPIEIGYHVSWRGTGIHPQPRCGSANIWCKRVFRY